MLRWNAPVDEAGAEVGRIFGYKVQVVAGDEVERVLEARALCGGTRSNRSSGSGVDATFLALGNFRGQVYLSPEIGGRLCSRAPPRRSPILAH